MRYYLDTEFMEDGVTILLLSIGIVAEDGAEMYWEVEDPPLHLASDWVKEHVIPHLVGRERWRSHAELAEELRRFINPRGAEFWAYYAAYDWVALCQIFGRMLDLPEGWPMHCMDLKQELVQQGIEKHHIPRHIYDHDVSLGVEHHALSDARWNRRLHQWIRAEIK